MTFTFRKFVLFSCSFGSLPLVQRPLDKITVFFSNFRSCSHSPEQLPRDGYHNTRAMQGVNPFVDYKSTRAKAIKDEKQQTNANCVTLDCFRCKERRGAWRLLDFNIMVCLATKPLRHTKVSDLHKQKRQTHSYTQTHTHTHKEILKEGSLATRLHEEKALDDFSNRPGGKMMLSLSLS